MSAGTCAATKRSANVDAQVFEGGTGGRSAGSDRSAESPEGFPDAGPVTPGGAALTPHQWDDAGERCLKCGDKDWMQTPGCTPSAAMHTAPGLASNTPNPFPNEDD